VEAEPANYPVSNSVKTANLYTLEHPSSSSLFCSLPPSSVTDAQSQAQPEYGMAGQAANTRRSIMTQNKTRQLPGAKSVSRETGVESHLPVDRPHQPRDL
jgi:hypothetical protein